MRSDAKTFMDSLRARLDPAAATIGNYITENTYLDGKRFSFDGHEFQKFIVDVIENNPGCTIVVKKPSQIGLSELFNRVILAIMALRAGTGVLISFPSKIFSQEVIKTRIEAVIGSSPALEELRDRNVDSASVKRFLNDSILYGLSGSSGSKSSLLNRPIKIVFVDEVDRQDVDVYSGFRSRQTHAAPSERLNLLVSTPTVEGVGIDAEYNDARVQYSDWLRCCECGHEFQPDYYKHIVIPDFQEPIELLTKIKAASCDLDSAYLECPGCKCSLTPENSEVYYKEKINVAGVKKKIGIALSPFVAMSFISAKDLVESSLDYTSTVEFLNQGLGRAVKASKSSITKEHITISRVANAAGVRVFGLDMGKECAFLSGLVNFDDSIYIDVIELVKLHELEDFLEDFYSKHVVLASVMDSMPYADMVYTLVGKYPRLFSAIYRNPVPQPPHLYTLKMEDKHNQLVRQINLTEGKVMDMAAKAIAGDVVFAPSSLDDTLITHLMSMRRVRDYRYSEQVYRWVKPKNGVDHFFHAFVYLFSATKLTRADLDLGGVNFPMQMFIVNTSPKNT